jgi:transposase InsO family protein
MEQCKSDRSFRGRDGNERHTGASRSDNGPEFVAKDLRQWLAGHRTKDTVHRAGISVGERILRIVQREAQKMSS